jgi:hypothetical protein
MYTFIVLAVLAIVILAAWAWRRGRSAANHAPTRAGSPRTPRADMTPGADPVAPEEGAD